MHEDGSVHMFETKIPLLRMGLGGHLGIFFVMILLNLFTKLEHFISRVNNLKLLKKCDHYYCSHILSLYEL